MNPLLEQFLIEARENLKFIEQNLEDLENADDELVNAIFRAAHTMKGGSGIVGFESLKALTHKAEDLLDKMRAKKITYSPDIQEVLYDVFDEVLNLVEASETAGDVVTADEDIQESLLSRLDVLLGVNSAAPKVFVMPFNVLSNTKLAINRDLKHLCNLTQKLPFEPIILDEQNHAQERAYLIYFDLTSDCMQFGNDPVYALSLLEDKLLGIDSTIQKDSAKKILTASTEEELLELYVSMVALAYSPWDDLESSLYNFLDDLSFMPISISKLLEVESENIGSAEFIKDFCTSAKSLLASKDVDGLVLAIDKSLELLNAQTLQAKMLTRLKQILPLTQESDLAKLNAFLDAVAQNTPYEHGKEYASTTPTQAASKQEVQQPTTKDEAAEEQICLNEKEKDFVKKLLQQQVDRLAVPSATRFANSIRDVMAQCAQALEVDLPPKTTDLHTLNDWAKFALTGAKKQEAAIVATGTAKPADISQTVNTEVPSQQVSKPMANAKAAMQKEQNGGQDKKDIIGKVVKIEQSSIDTLMSVVGELLVAKNSLPYLADSVTDLTSDAIKRAIMEKYSHVNRLTDQLQDLIMSMRMLPISYVFDRYPKLVREISKNLSKKVKLIQDGGETKLDKNMIEMLADPLIHIVRNSLDHGIEKPEDRIDGGKDETGTLTMKAYPQSDKVIIEIIDDGKGIDAQRVASKVLEKGLLPVEKIEAMSEQEKIELVMLPGLSTAETVSEYSGRGVGMDVVKKSIESFGGTIVINSEMGKGTKITLSIPVSLAVSTLLHVLMDEEHYGFPMDAVSETVKVEWDKITYLYNEPYIYLRDQVIPIIFLGGMLDAQELKTKPLSLVVLLVRGNPIALAVNELIGQLEVVQKPLEGLLMNHPLISGTALLGNGQIIMIIDPIRVLDLGDNIKDKTIALEVANAIWER